MSDPIIELDNVQLTLTSKAGPVHILRGVSLTVPRGQSAAILGPSGSGKTSLLMVMAGLEQATGGKVVAAGKSLAAMSEDELALLRGADMGVIFQSFHLVPTMTALENVALPMELAGEANAFDNAHQLLKEVGLAERVDHFPAELSGGEQQRVAIARALVRQPRIVLADEPTGNLDGRTGRQIVELLFGAHARRNATMIIVTHDERLAAMADRVIRMADGNIVSDELTNVATRAVSS
ncbi:ABC transporter [Hyphomicrobium methylovorum]|uniref:ABC transporter ATP-binding protein n=1 Tax=Hyphomicrobium methylovorum TaxID=84 RepID=UPI0015E7BC4F|nr:ABC transporter ATP-binding protein [Hyphomicrobium methylovorum]MBA2126116.1 ABC transporter [Hyphomicrobium methylovorum]